MGTGADENGSDWQEKIRQRELRRHAETLARFAAKIEEGQDFPNDAPRRFAKLVGQTAKVIAENLNHTPRNMLENIHFFLCDLTSILRYAERSRMAHTPWSMIQAMETFLRRYVGENTYFLIRPQWAHNYGISSYDLVDAVRSKLKSFDWISIPEWGKRAGVIRENKETEALEWTQIYSLSFPRIERNNVLLHAVFGHEIGHTISQNIVTERSNAIWKEEEASINAQFTSEVEASLPDTVDDLFRRSFIVNQVWSRMDAVKATMQQAFSELVADHIAVHVFGPAAFASLADIASFADIDANPLKCQNYPPWRYRLRLLGESIQEDIDRMAGLEGEEEVATELAAFIKWLRNVISAVGEERDMQYIKAESVTREAYALVEKHLRALCKTVIDQLPSEQQTPYYLSARRTTVKDLVGKLERNIPPNEVGDWPDAVPAELADILNAGWAFKFSELAKNSNWASIDNSEALFRLVLKAIEASDVHQTYGPKLNAKSPV